MTLREHSRSRERNIVFGWNFQNILRELPWENQTFSQSTGRGQLWQRIETLSFTWLDAARRAPQGGMEKFLEDLSFKESFCEKTKHCFDIWLEVNWQYFETLNFTWLDAARRAPQDAIKRFLEVSSLTRENSEKHQKKTIFLLSNFSKNHWWTEHRKKFVQVKFLFQQIFTWKNYGSPGKNTRSFGLCNKKLRKKNSPPAAMFGGLAERLLRVTGPPYDQNFRSKSRVFLYWQLSQNWL